MSTNAAVTVDLDGTLLHGTQEDYDNAREAFAELAAESFDDVTVEEAAAAQKEYSRTLLDTFGLSKERFPEACVRALDELGAPDEALRERARAIGREAFRSESEYAERGLADGAEALFETALARADVFIVTAGDEEIQQRKLDALSIPEAVETSIVEIGGKVDTLQELQTQYERVVHIGNSASSDVGAAAEAEADCIYVPNEEWRENEVDSTDIPHFRVAADLVEAEQHLSAYFNPPVIH